jgi:hypothetical protein
MASSNYAVSHLLHTRDEITQTLARKTLAAISAAVTASTHYAETGGTSTITKPMTSAPETIEVTNDRVSVLSA